MRLVSILLFAFTALVRGESPADLAAAELIKRVVPGQAARFAVDTALPKREGHDAFTVSDSQDGKILLRGSDGVAVASALNWYLKNRCHAHLSWCGDQMALPNPLPKVGEAFSTTTTHRHRIYFNYCTLSYSAAWWDWKRWQREIDFMAMQGINTPLSVVGLEAVWYHTLLKHGFSDAEAREYLVGPAYFAWQWMTNIESHAGPLPKSWLDSHIKLGQQILERQRALGMTPIQQGFSGCVPRLMAKKFPDAAIKNGPAWCNFPGTAQLDPLDPLFAKLGKTFLEEQQRLFGSSHLYGCDPFHEGAPPSEAPEYLAKVGAEIQRLLNEHDRQSTWVMQSWSIRKPIATAVPKDRLLVVDLGGSKHTSTEAFWGYPFVSGRLHNFGNRINLHGDMRKLATNPFAEIARKYSNSAGMGLFMEGIIQNPAYYDLAFDTIWRDEPVDPVAWLNDYARRRYGADSAKARQAWEILLDAAYKPGTDGVENSSIICARPAINVKKSGPNAGFKIPYEPARLFQAWALLLEDADQLKSSDAYRYDIVDIGRQVLSNHGQLLQKRIQTAFAAKDVAAFDKASQDFLQLLADVDALLAPRPELSLGKWVNDARAQGTTTAEKNLYELNARELVTLWGPIDNPSIFDYSWREWHGLIGSFYKVRWEKFLSHVSSRLKSGEGYSEEDLPQQYGREAWRANDFYRQLADWERAWVTTPAPIAKEPQGDAVDLARGFLAKYRDAILAGSPARDAADAVKLGKAVGEWSAGTVTTTSTSHQIDIAPHLDGEGRYVVTFLCSSGRARLEIQSVELLANGQVIASDVHEGRTGNEHVGNTYTLSLPEHAFGTSYQLRYSARTHGGTTDSTGTVYLRKLP